MQVIPSVKKEEAIRIYVEAQVSCILSGRPSWGNAEVALIRWLAARKLGR